LTFAAVKAAVKEVMIAAFETVCPVSSTWLGEPAGALEQFKKCVASVPLYEMTKLLAPIVTRNAPFVRKPVVEATVTDCVPVNVLMLTLFEAAAIVVEFAYVTPSVTVV
jgi:hypothetical protein